MREQIQLLSPFYVFLSIHPSALIIASSAHLCSDDLYQDCDQRASRGECQGIGNGSNDQDIVIRKMLSQCRQTCRKLWHATDPPDLVSKYGGLGDSIRDSFGFDHHLCGPAGLTSEGRASLMLYQARISEQIPWLPKFTESGFQKLQIPAKLWETLSRSYNEMLPRIFQVIYQSRHIDNQQLVEEDGHESFLRPVSRLFEMKLNPGISEEVGKVLQPLAEVWSGVLLEYHGTQNVRRYTNGSSVAAHLDGIGHLIIGAIMNMGQEVEVDWPLYLKDHQGVHRKVILHPGEMVFFESARVVHGRLEPLNGKFYDNMFVYFKPRGLWYNDAGVFEIGKRPRKEGPLTKEMIIASQKKDKCDSDKSCA